MNQAAGLVLLHAVSFFDFLFHAHAAKMAHKRGHRIRDFNLSAVLFFEGSALLKDLDGEMLIRGFAGTFAPKASQHEKSSICARTATAAGFLLREKYSRSVTDDVRTLFFVCSHLTFPDSFKSLS